MKPKSIIGIAIALAFIGMQFTSVVLSPSVVIPMFSPGMRLFGIIIGILCLICIIGAEIIDRNHE